MEQPEEVANLLFDPPDVFEGDTGGLDQDTERVQDWQKIELIQDILDKVRNGRKINLDYIGADPETNFYMLGLAPNNARLAVRFWHVDSFGNFVTKAARHHLDM
ncbi:MAG TPA: type I-C CRISPR-associated protein Cas8c/Csd1, partial [Methanoculleus sp.]|nr:type I-C CRISPR-associated protein Cas8c/Csd1 [Methanoculleus sp.]